MAWKKCRSCETEIPRSDRYGGLCVECWGDSPAGRAHRAQIWEQYIENERRAHGPYHAHIAGAARAIEVYPEDELEEHAARRRRNPCRRRRNPGEKPSAFEAAFLMKDGRLRSFAEYGGYPIFYLDHQDQVLCPECANKSLHDAVPHFRPVAGDVNWEDEELYCDQCSEQIESAYGDDE